MPNEKFDRTNPTTVDQSWTMTGIWLVWRSLTAKMIQMKNDVIWNKTLRWTRLSGRTRDIVI